MNKKNKTLLIFVSLILAAIAIVVFLALDNVNNKGNDEWSNNATLITEIGVGIIVALIILMLTKLNEHKMDAKISSVLNIVEEREKIQKDKEKQIRLSVVSALTEIFSHVLELPAAFKVYENIENKIEKKEQEELIMKWYTYIKHISEEHLDDKNIISIEFFSRAVIEKIKVISNLCKIEPKFGEDNTAKISDYKILADTIWSLIRELNKKTRSKMDPKQPEPKENINGIQMSVSPDRTVYPLNSIIHIQASISPITQNKDILFEIFDTQKKPILSKTIDPSKYDYSESEEDVFQVRFKMEDSEWEVGKRYIVSATHGTSHAEDSFLVDRRTPIIQSDKEVYTSGNGSDMILTVIDLDGDKDGHMVDYVGDYEDAKLIIESSHGKIEGYRLKETGKSTGIFQGLIGILKVRKDGSVVPEISDGRTIDRTQGTGLKDGYIAVASDDTLTISYKKDGRVTRYTVDIMDFGAVVELDKDTYQTADKVHITIVAPDLDIDQDVIGKIGSESDSFINIRTSIDEIKGYNLVETGAGTGMFIGEIQLVRREGMVLSESRGIGPTDGKLFCTGDDSIEVSFNMFGTKIVQKSLIKSLK